MALVEYTKAMSEERFLAIYQGLEAQGYGPMDQHVAQALRFRLPAIRRLPMEKRAQRAKRMLSSSVQMAELAYELFGSYLMKHKKELITGFLDATGVPHEEGMIDDTSGTLPAEDRIEAAIESLDAEHGADDVTLYLGLCVQMWPESATLSRLWQERSGVATG